MIGVPPFRATAGGAKLTVIIPSPGFTFRATGALGVPAINVEVESIGWLLPASFTAITLNV